MSDLTGKVFIVTGGESGIGQAIALRAASDEYFANQYRPADDRSLFRPTTLS